MSLEAGSRKVHAHFSSLMHTFWCRALTDTGRPQKGLNSNKKSQCTFWCRVLTDCRLCKPRRSTVYSTVIATGDPCTLTHR